MAREPDPKRLLELLQGERAQREEFGVAPGAESVELLIDSFPDFELGQGDLAFLFAALALLLSGETDEAIRSDLEFALVASMQLVSAVALSHVPDTVLDVARLDAGVGPAPTLYALLVGNRKRSVEVVIKPSAHRAAAFNDPAEAVASLASWMRTDG